MPAAITDKVRKTFNSANPNVARVNTTRTTGATTLVCNDLTGWPTDTAVDFSTYQVSATGTVVAGTQIDWVGIVSGNSLLNITRKAGAADSGNAINDYVEMNPTASWANDLATNILTHANQDGTLKSTAVQTALNVSGSIPTGYTALATVPTLSATNGNNSFDISFPSVDYTDRLSKGMKLLIPRTVTPQTQVTNLNGTTQYWSKTSPAGMTFTDDFCAGAWVYLTSYAASDMDIISRYNGTSGWALKVDTSGKVLLAGYNAASGNVSYVRSYQSIPLNRWVHVSCQLDMSAFTATTTTSYVMIDGVDAPAEVIRTGTNPTALIQAGNLEVGSRNGGTEPFPGRIAQAFVSSAKITQANIRNFMYHGITSTDVSTYSLVSAYSFGGNANDLNTGNANNLSANGSATATYSDSPFNANCYAIITSAPTYSTNTTMTVQTAVGYGIPNETLGTSSYTSLHRPLGFPSERDKWTITTISQNDRTTTSTSLVSLTDNIVVPIGSWEISVKAQLEATVATTNYRVAIITLSSDGTTETNARTTGIIGIQPTAATVSLDSTIHVFDNVNPSSQTTYTLIGRVNGTLCTLTLAGSSRTPTVIRAVCAYL